MYVWNVTLFRAHRPREGEAPVKGDTQQEAAAGGEKGSESESESSQRSSTGKDFEMVDQEDLES